MTQRSAQEQDASETPPAPQDEDPPEPSPDEDPEPSQDEDPPQASEPEQEEDAPEDSETPPEEDPVPLAGIWLLESGAVLTEHQHTAFELHTLVLNEDGSASAHLQDPGSGVAGCFKGTYEPVGQAGFILEIPGLTDVLFPDGSIGSSPQLMSLEMPDEETLELEDPQGAAARFSRQDAVDADLRCKSLKVRETHTYSSVRLSFGGGLVYDGSLWFYDEESRLVRSVDPQTGVLGADSVKLDHEYVHAMQDGTFWGHCSCSGTNTPEIARANKNGDEVASIFMEQDLGKDRFNLGVSMAYSGEALLIHGLDAGVYKILEVDVSGAPQLLREAEFDLPVEAMTWDGKALWLITEGPRQIIVKMDATTFAPLATYHSPDLQVRWNGIAAVDADLFIIGTDLETEETVLMQVAKSLLNAPSLPTGVILAAPSGL